MTQLICFYIIMFCGVQSLYPKSHQASIVLKSELWERIDRSNIFSDVTLINLITENSTIPNYFLKTEIVDLYYDSVEKLFPYLDTENFSYCLRISEEKEAYLVKRVSGVSSIFYGYKTDDAYYSVSLTTFVLQDTLYVYNNNLVTAKVGFFICRSEVYSVSISSLI